MNHYELAYVLDPDLSQEELASTSEGFASLISEQGAAITAAASWGKRRLAYEVNKKREGCYFFVQFESDVGALPELNRQLRLSDKVMRHMIVKLDERFLEEAALPAEQAPSVAAEAEEEPEPEPEAGVEEGPETESDVTPAAEAGEVPPETEVERAQTVANEPTKAESDGETSPSEGRSRPAEAQIDAGQGSDTAEAAGADDGPEAN